MTMTCKSARQRVDRLNKKQQQRRLFYLEKNRRVVHSRWIKREVV